jgi:hypothetical protein
MNIYSMPSRRRFPPPWVHLSRGNSKISDAIERIAKAETNGPHMNIPINPQRLPDEGEEHKSAFATIIPAT